MTDSDLVPTDLPKYAAAGSFRHLGRRFVQTSTEIGGLDPSSRVLDIGCGVGRFAVGLTEVLTDGTYDGTDIVAKSIDWCSQNITPRFPNFRFHLIEAKNDNYAPEHAGAASDVPFTFDDDSFDFIFANSLYTHLLEADTVHYFNEMARVLSPGAKFLITIFLLDGPARGAIEAGKAARGWTLAHQIGQASVENPSNPEAVVAYEQDFITSILDGAGISHEIHRGQWSGAYEAHPYFGNKDIIVGTLG
jgi:SAM-dependent methyltransferase